MKITASAGQLAEVLALAASLVSHKAARRIPMLGYAHLKAEGSALAITTDILDHYPSDGGHGGR